MNNFEYPFVGRFFRFTTNTSDVAPDELTPTTKALTGEVMCDIQEDKGEKLLRGTLSYTYVVYFEDRLSILEGDYFEADMYGKKINGIVVFIVTNELGTKVRIEDKTTDSNG